MLVCFFVCFPLVCCLAGLFACLFARARLVVAFVGCLRVCMGGDLCVCVCAFVSLFVCSVAWLCVRLLVWLLVCACLIA